MESEDSYYQKVPIAALTADAVYGTKELLLKSGFDDFLSKPIDITIMNAALERWIPKEKQKPPLEDTSPFAEAEEDKQNQKIKIGTLDTEKGIAMAGGKIERYQKILSLFSKDVDWKLKEIKTSLESGNTSLYVIHVHALKSATAIIGADGLSETARLLEMAGKQEDLAYIQTNNDAFITDLKALLHNINTFLSEEADIDQEHVMNKDSLKNELFRLKAALESFDFTEINHIVNSLQEFTQAADVGEAVNAILQSKLVGDYDETAALVESLLQELNK
jgi:HPt (histidine-containing phosphotransfer) domain-containing protein